MPTDSDTTVRPVYLDVMDQVITDPEAIEGRWVMDQLCRLTEERDGADVPVSDLAQASGKSAAEVVSIMNRFGRVAVGPDRERWTDGKLGGICRWRMKQAVNPKPPRSHLEWRGASDIMSNRSRVRQAARAMDGEPRRWTKRLIETSSTSGRTVRMTLLTLVGRR